PQGAQTVVTALSTVYVTQVPLNPPVPDYLGYSIFTILCCCLPLGIAGLIYSISTRDANNQGQRELAERSSCTAWILNSIGLAIGIAVTIAWIAII
uniref:Si:rp71-77l1.1 n=1 Tax=Paramormyrops kingsleyae TaxID=1676925 RepID=A0A3B3QIK2_9TELE